MNAWQVNYVLDKINVLEDEFIEIRMKKNIIEWNKSTKTLINNRDEGCTWKNVYMNKKL